MKVHRIPMTDHTREQISSRGGKVSTARKGKHGHSVKNRTMLAVQKYPLHGSI